MRKFAVVMIATLLGGCAFPNQVHRFGVEYNTALANMNNEQTLVNILRARDGMPSQTSSVSQFRGSINLTAGASLNAQLKGSGLTDVTGSGTSSTVQTSNSTTTALSAPGALPSTSTVAGTATTPGATTSVMRTLAEGVDMYTPQISGQIVSGTAFDVDVYDTSKFFGGITSPISFSTVQSFLAEGIDNRVIALVMIAQVDFRIDEDQPGFPKGTTIRSFINDPNDPVRSSAFAKFVTCYELSSGVVPKKSTPLVAISRFTRGADGKPAPMPLDKVTVVDGEKFDFSQEGVPGATGGDDNIFLNRVTAEQRVARLSQRPTNCAGPGDNIRSLTMPNGKSVTVAVPAAPPPDPIYLGEGYAMLFAGGRLQTVKVSIEITFRSPEGLYRYLGAYLSNRLGETILLDGQPVFSITDGRSDDALATTIYRKKTYSLVNLPGTHNRNAQIFTMLQQLINLQKEASERPTTIPVRAIP